MSLHVLLGGQKSGKSSMASRLAAASGRPVTVVAPAEAGNDAEFAERIGRHRAERPSGWRTLESFDLLDALDAAGTGSFVIVDALDTWLLRVAGDEELLPDGDVAALGPSGRRAYQRILDRVRRFADRAIGHDGPVVVIAGQPGWGMVPLGVAARRYADLHGLASQLLVEAADSAWLVVAGRRIPLPEEPDDAVIEP